MAVYRVPFVSVVSSETFIERINVKFMCELEPSEIVNHCRTCPGVPVRSSSVKHKWEFLNLLPVQLVLKLFSK